MKEAVIGYACLAFSICVHGFAVLGHAQPAQPARRSQLTELELAPLAQPEPPRPPALEPVNKPRPAPALKKLPAQPLPSLAAPEVSQTPPEPPEPEPTGRTLTAAGDASWSAPAGNAAERDPTRGVGAAAPHLAPVPTPSRAPSPSVSATQPLAQLSQKPAPPSLAAALERNYPAAARRQGKSGDAKVRALIDASGRATTVTVTSESSPGFGAACQRTLLQSQWTPPLGPHGEPTATFVGYRCRFQVND